MELLKEKEGVSAPERSGLQLDNFLLDNQPNSKLKSRSDFSEKVPFINNTPNAISSSLRKPRHITSTPGTLFLPEIKPPKRAIIATASFNLN